jgi:hypothetical protein
MGMPDTDNDEVRGSLERETRRIQNPYVGRGEVYPNEADSLYLIDITYNLAY